MKNYHIALFINTASRGAFATFASGVSWGLYTQGIRKIDLLYYNGPEENHYARYAPGVKFKKLKGGRGIFIIFALRQYLIKKKPDYIISAPIHVNLLSLLVRWSSKKIRKATKFIITHHHPMLPSYKNSRKDNIWLAKLMYKYASASFGVTENAVMDAVINTRIDINKTRVIPNILIPFEMEKKDIAGHPWLNKKDFFVFITVSRLVKLKNIPLLIKAFNQIDRPHAKLLIIGDGEMKPAIKKLVKQYNLTEKIQLCGFVVDPRQYMAKADCFVLASNEEGFGQVITEAMSIGLPVISTDAKGGGPKSVLENGKWGILTPAGNKICLANAMNKMLNPNTNQYYRTLSTKRSKDFSSNAIGPKLIDFLKTYE